MKIIKGKGILACNLWFMLTTTWHYFHLIVLSAVSDYRMVCFVECGYTKSLDVFGTSECNAPM
jgi:hypothetical protein